MIYLDYAATSPLDEEAAEAYIRTATSYYGNSSSLHDIGSAAQQLLEGCRKELARTVNIPVDGIYFTSGGSESNYLAIQSLLSATTKKGKHVITSMAEHGSVRGVFEKIKEQGYDVTYLPLNSDGLIDLVEFKEAVREDTILVSIQYINSEIGSIQPIKEIGKICKEENILFHSDCVQAFGKIDLGDAVDYLDSFSISGHKFYGPKGIGAVFVHPRLHWQPYYPGATHESGFRPGTVNVPAIVSMTVAMQKAYKEMEKNLAHYRNLRNIFMDTIRPYKNKITIYEGTTFHQLPSIIGFGIKGLEGQWVMLECNRAGFAISTGSACHSGMQTPSQTMKALSIPDKIAKEFIRISFGKDTTEEHVRQIGKLTNKIIEEEIVTDNKIGQSVARNKND